MENHSRASAGAQNTGSGTAGLGGHNTVALAAHKANTPL